MLPVIFGLEGLALTPAEAALFRDARPAGYILFRRNVATPDQVRALTDSLRALAGNDRLPILIDQEGGRVARLQPPHWPAFPSAATFGAAFEKAPLTALAAAEANARAIALMLRPLGVTVDCLPLLDVASPGMDAVIGDRSFGADPSTVASLGRAVLDGLKSGGCVGVVKHIPGHGRATCDSHKELPRVDAPADALEADILPFKRLASAPMAMTAHILYPAWDEARCASLSPVIITDVIRGAIGFDNLLMSDDLGMEALASQPGGATMAGRAQGVVEAGCDLALHCSGKFAEMEEIAGALDEASAATQDRLAGAMDWCDAPDEAAFAEEFALATERRNQLLAAAYGGTVQAVTPHTA